MADLTADDCWSAIYSIADEYLADKIQPHVIGKLIATGFVELDANGLPELTDKGWRAHTAAASGEGPAYELEWLSPEMD